jgi:parvulin-like peptidyl-prolyl isomerase
LISFVIGCDQLEKILNPKKTVVKPSTTAQQPAAPKAAEQKVSGTQLAKVNDKVITLEEFQQNIKNLEALSPEIKIDTFDLKKSLLDEMVNQELLYQEAKSRGIQNRQEIKDLADGYLRGLVVRQLMIDVTENITVDPQEIEVFYNQYKDQLGEPEQRHIREIVVGSEDEAKQILVSLLQGGDFASLATEKSISTTKQNAGDLGFITRGQRGEEYKKFDDVAFSLELGQPSTVFKGPQGYCIVKAEEIKESKVRPITEVWDQVKNSLLPLKQQQRVQELIDKLKANSTIEVKEEMLQK